jgi:hypothetical protein
MKLLALDSKVMNQAYALKKVPFLFGKRKNAGNYLGG